MLSLAKAERVSLCVISAGLWLCWRTQQGKGLFRSTVTPTSHSGQQELTLVALVRQAPLMQRPSLVRVLDTGKRSLSGAN